MSVCVCVCAWDKVFEFVSSSGCVFPSGLGLDHDGFKTFFFKTNRFFKWFLMNNNRLTKRPASLVGGTPVTTLLLLSSQEQPIRHCCNHMWLFFPLSLHCKWRGWKLVAKFFPASQTPWNDLFIYQNFVLFGPITFGKSRRAVQLNHLSSFKLNSSDSARSTGCSIQYLCGYLFLHSFIGVKEAQLLMLYSDSLTSNLT